MHKSKQAPATLFLPVILLNGVDSVVFIRCSGDRESCEALKMLTMPTLVTVNPVVITMASRNNLNITQIDDTCLLAYW